jgi:Spy/CpxP family protein refolding chaperone
MNSRRFVPVAAMALRISLAVPLFAAPVGGGPAGSHHGFHGAPGMEALDLTEAQKAQMKTFWKEQHEQMSAAFQELEQAHRDLRAEIFADAPDAGKIQTLQAKVADLESRMLAARVQMDQRLASILTADQRKTMATLPPPHEGWDHHGEHHGPRPHGDEPPSDRE